MKEEEAPSDDPFASIRPRTRSDCKDACRPCPWVSCKHHLYLDVNPRTGRIRRMFPGLEVWELQHTCALDIAEMGGMTHTELSKLMGISVKRLKRAESSGLKKLGVEADLQRPLLHVSLVGIGQRIGEAIRQEPDYIHRITALEFEALIEERLNRMGLEVRRTGGTYDRDGGIDFICWPRSSPIPFLIGVQAKHHRNAGSRVGQPIVRDFAGAIGGHRFAAGLLVTNTSFTPDAEWFAANRAQLVMLKGLVDLRRWVINESLPDFMLAEIPEEIEITKGFRIKLR